MKKEVKEEIPRKDRPELDVITNLEDREKVQRYMDNYDWITDTSEKFSNKNQCCICGEKVKGIYNGKYYCPKHCSQIRSHNKVMSHSIHTPNEIKLVKDYAILTIRNREQEVIEEFTIDIQSLPKIITRKWSIVKGRNDRLVCLANKGADYAESLHRLVIGANAKDPMVIFIDGDHHNVRLSNLKFPTIVQDEESREVTQAYTPRNQLLSFKLRGSESFSEVTGTIRYNKQGDRYKVVGQTDIRSGKSNKFSHYLIEFDDETQLVIGLSTLSLNSFRNPNKPIAYDRGFTGQGAYTSTTHSKEYRAWHGMLQRCYSPEKEIKYPTYEGVTVDPRWFNFQNFCEDIKYLEGYKAWKENTKKFAYALDKDIKVEGNKIYSKDTCIFTTCKENVRKATLTGKTYLATNIATGHTKEFCNMAQFAKDNNFQAGCIGGCIQGKRKTHKGWTFKIL